MTTFRKLPIIKLTTKVNATKKAGIWILKSMIDCINRSFFCAAQRLPESLDNYNLIEARTTGAAYTTLPIWKIGKYIATIKPPITTPNTAIIIGSSKLVKPSTMSSTSAS